MVRSWRVDGDITSFDHNALITELVLRGAPAAPLLENASGTLKYNTRQVDWLEFADAFRAKRERNNATAEHCAALSTEADVEGATTVYVAALAAACDATIPAARPPRLRKDPPWWSIDLEIKKKKLEQKKGESDVQPREDGNM